MNNSIMNALKAENLLAGVHVLEQMEMLKTALQYKSDDKFVAYDDHFRFLQTGIDGIKSLKLLDRISSGQAGMAYENELLTGLEEIQDQCERWTVKVIRFQGDVTRAKSEVEELRAAFIAWYSLAAQDELKRSGIKLSAANVSDLAASEFNRIMDRSNLTLEALIESLKIEVKRIDNRRKMAKTKFDMGREQVNAAWSNQLPPSLGISPNAPKFGVLQQPDYDDVEPTPTVPLSGATPLQEVAEQVADQMIENLRHNVAAQREQKQAAEVYSLETTPAGTFCAECWSPQFNTPAGVNCNNGHGGAGELDADELDRLRENNKQLTQSLTAVAIEIGKTAFEPEPEPEIKGTFYKQGTPAPVTVIADFDDLDDTPAIETESQESGYDDVEVSQDHGIDYTAPVQEAEPQETTLIVAPNISAEEVAKLRAHIDEAITDPDYVTVTEYEVPVVWENPKPQVEVVPTRAVEIVNAPVKYTEVALIDESKVVDPIAGIAAPRNKMDFDDLDDGDFSTPKQEGVAQPVPAPVPAVEKKPEPTPAPKPAPAATRKPMNFDFDDDEF